MITASAPTRVDLAGGTIDIWPLCHLLDRPAVTVNLAIDLRAEVTLEERGDGWLEVISEDRGESARMRVDAIEHGTLGLATRMVEWFGPGDGLTVRMRSRVPARSGLGGSSALLVALAGALGKLRGVAFPGDGFRTFVQNIEAQLLSVPTGYQDYYPPILGGLNVLRARPEGVEIERIEAAEEFLARHLVLVDTQIEHESGMNNWEVFRRFIGGDTGVRAALNAINDCSTRMADAVAARDLRAAAGALADEWDARKRLAPVVTSATIDAVVEDALGRGALAAKICGAGGGGCLALLVEDASIPLRNRVDFRPASDGLRVG